MSQELSLIDILKHLSEDRDDRWHEIKKQYNPFMVNRFLSMDPNLYHFAEASNKLSVAPQQHYEFLMRLIPKRKRYFKYLKKDPLSDLCIQISDTLKINHAKARVGAKIIEREILKTK